MLDKTNFSSLKNTVSPAGIVNPEDPEEDAEMRGEGNQEATSAAKSLESNSSSASTADESLFIDRLVRLASNGELSTHGEVLDVFLFTFGEQPEVSEDFFYNLTRRLANPPETPAF